MHPAPDATGSVRPPAPMHNASRPRRAFKATRLRTKSIYFDAVELAAAYDCEVQVARKRMKAWGFGVRRGRHWLTTRELIIGALPEEGAELVAVLEHNRATRARRHVLRGQVLYHRLDELAAKIGWQTKRLRRRCQRHGSAIKRGGRWYVTEGLLRRVLAAEDVEALKRLEAVGAER